MKRKDKLYTVNKWNRPMFLEETPQSTELLGRRFDEGGSTVENDNDSGNIFSGRDPFARPFLSSENTALAKDATLKQNIQPMTFSRASSPREGLSDIGKLGLSAAVSGVGGFGKNLISDGFSTGAGETVAGVGSAVGSAVSMVNPLVGAAINLGSNLIGGLVNRGWGFQRNEKNIAKVRDNAATMDAAGNALAGSTSTDSFMNAASMMGNGLNFKDNYISKGGWFMGDKVKKEAHKYRNLQASAEAMQAQGLATGADQVQTNQALNARRNFAAFGGPLDVAPYQTEQSNTNGMGAIEYGFMNDYLLNKKKQVEGKNSSLGSSFGWMPQGGLYAFGGDMEGHGSDFPTRLTHIEAGGSHEENPYEGVQIGQDKSGIPNLVEEGEAVYDDYVYSARIPCDESTKQRFHLPEKKTITYAELAKRLEKEISGRPNDPLSQAGFKAQMHQLAEEQERQKQEMEAQRAREAFEALSDDEKAVLMKEVASRMQQTGQDNPAVNGMQDDSAVVQQSTQQGAVGQGLEMPEEAAGMNLQPSGNQGGIGIEPQMQACGGFIHRFDAGGSLKERLYKAMGWNTDSDFYKWAKSHKLLGEDSWGDGKRDAAVFEDEDWTGIMKDSTFLHALKDNPALADALSKGYDFGVYAPENLDKATIQSISRGNWKGTDGKGWKGSKDLAFLQATEGLSDAEIDALTTEQLAERMKNTPAYRNTSKWLENSDNALLYLNTLLNDADTPQVAKDYAGKFIKDGRWKDGFTYDYGTVFGRDGKGVRETNPGTYWHSVQEANRNSQTGNFVLNDDGSIEPIVGDVPSDWVSEGNYSWSSPETDYNYSYYRKPSASSEKVPAGTSEVTDEEIAISPKHRSESLRYTGLMGPAVGLGLMASGIGRPDTSELRASQDILNTVHTASPGHVGGYYLYEPFDVWSQRNRNAANTRAAEREILNRTAPIGTQMAGLLANNYMSQLADADLGVKAHQYNNAERMAALNQQKDTDKWNVGVDNEFAKFNTDILNRNRQARANMAYQTAGQQMDADASWYNSIYGNVGTLFKGLSDLGRENAERNMVADMAADGIFGVMDDQYIGRDYLTRRKKK